MAIFNMSNKKEDINIYDYELKGILGIKYLSNKCKGIISMDSEEETKMSLILPLISSLGYDIHDNRVLKSEYVADVGIKKGEKVDYAIIIDGQPSIIIEAKQVGVDLTKYISQLYRYFSVTNAKVGILTDGVRYLFFTDYIRENIMDLEPYMYINMRELTEFNLSMLLLYSKNIFNKDDINNHVKYNILNNKVRTLMEGIFNKDVDTEITSMFAREVGLEKYSKGLIDDMFESELNRQARERFLTLENYIEHNSYEDYEIQGETENRGKEGKNGRGNIYKIVDNSINLDKEYNIGEVNVHGHKMEYAVIEGEKFDSISYANLLVEVLNVIYREDSRKIDSLLEDPDFQTDRYSKITTDINMTRKPRELEYRGVFVETHLGGPDLIKLTMQMMDKCGMDYEKVKIKFKR